MIGFILILSILLQSYTWGIFIDQMKHTTDKLSIEIKKLLKETTQYDILESEYKRLYDEKIIEISKTSVKNVSAYFAKNLQNMLNDKSKSLSKIKERATFLYENYKYDPKIQPYDYYNRRSGHPVKEEITFFKGKEININRSHVQAPTNIFNMHPDVLNAAKWSEKLDEVFTDNYNKSRDLLWQYLGTESGMFRSYPGKNDKSEYSFYDARRRLWYSEAINSAKDVAIAIDLSGSVIGTPFKIVKLVVKSLIDTFQQNDFFNVVYNLNNQPYLMIECIDKLIQATKNNKDLFSKKVDNLETPNGEGDVLKLIGAALKILNDSSTDDLVSSRCNKVLMLISDGLDHNDDLHELLKSFSHLNVVLFYYFIGHGKTNNNMREVALEHGGDMYSFPTLGSVRNGVLEYQNNLNEPFLDLSFNSSNVRYTPLYNDYAADGNGLGLMITIAVSVIGESEENENKLIGVAGIDVRMTILEQQYPTNKLGAFGHAFAINNNGVILIHPQLREIGELFPDLSTIYLEEVEYAKEIDEIKNLMINRVTSCLDSELDIHFPRDIKTRHIKVNATYCLEKINDTPFSSAVVMPEFSQYRLKLTDEYSKTFSNSSIGALLSNDIIKNKIADWLFCDFESEEQKVRPASQIFYPTAEELHKYITLNGANHSTCETQLLNDLLLSATVIWNHTKTYWNKTNITDRYIITTNGLISTDKYSEMEIGRDIFSSEFLLHPLCADESTIVFTVPIKRIYKRPSRISHTNNDIGISMGKAGYIENIIWGVTGIQISADYLLSLLINASKEYQCLNCEQFHCSDLDNYACFLVDENGYVVTSNQGLHHMGVFLGLINGKLIETLLENDIYEKFMYNDTQSVCNDTVVKNTITTNSASSSRSSLFINFFKTLKFITFKILTVFYFLIENIFIQKVHTQTAEYKKQQSICTKRITLFKRTKKIQHFAENLTCSQGCADYFSLKKVPDTNLDFIVIKNNCDEQCSNYVISNEPIKIEDTDICSKKIKYRKAMPTCYQKLPVDSRSAATKIKYFKTFLLSMIMFSVKKNTLS